MARIPFIYPDTELGRARQELYEMLPAELKNKFFGDIAWKWSISTASVSNLFSTEAVVNPFPVNKMQELLERHLPEADSQRIGQLLEVIHRHAIVRYKKVPVLKNDLTTEQGQARQALDDLLPITFKKKLVGEKSEITGLHPNIIVSLMSPQAPIRPFSIERVHEALMRGAKIPEERSGKLQEALTRLHNAGRAASIFPKDELGEARSALFKFFAEKLEVSHPREIAAQGSLSKNRLRMILGPKTHPKHFKIKDAHDMFMEELGLPDEKSEEVLELLTTIRGYVGKQNTQERGL